MLFEISIFPRPSQEQKMEPGGVTLGHIGPWGNCNRSITLTARASDSFLSFCVTHRTDRIKGA